MVSPHLRQPTYLPWVPYRGGFPASIVDPEFRSCRPANGVIVSRKDENSNVRITNRIAERIAKKFNRRGRTEDRAQIEKELGMLGGGGA